MKEYQLQIKLINYLRSKKLSKFRFFHVPNQGVRSIRQKLLLASMGMKSGCPDLILEFKVWREKYSQPIVTKNYSEFIPSNTTPVKNLYFSSMCQIYPEDRGTNYAVREGLKISKFIEQEIKKGKE